MDQEQEKFDNVMKVLRRSQPDMGDIEQFSEKVMRKIRQERTRVSLPELIYEFIFGWVYVGWMRRAMVTASICLMLFFGYQQTVTLKRIESLSLRSVIDADLMKTGMNSTLPDRWKPYTIFGNRTNEGRMEIPENKLDKFIESVNKFQEQNEEIFRLIESDPKSKEYVYERLNKNVSVKTKI
jgi:hypothetical protein